MSFETIQYLLQDGIVTVTLNRPERLNAVTGQMIDELIAAIDRFDADDGARVMVVTGAGRAFCAGADLGRGGDTFNADRDADAGGGGLHPDGGGRVTLRLYDCNKPVIAAINGPAVGFGITMTLAMDIRLAADDARMGFVFSRRGIVPEACSSWFLPRIVGIAQALAWTYSGKVFPASEALTHRLVSSLHPRAELLPAAYAIARELADQTSAVSLALIRQMMWKMLGADHPMAAHQLDSRGVYHTGRSADAREGVQSFIEKRPAQFPGTVPASLPPFIPWWTPRQFE